MATKRGKKGSVPTVEASDDLIITITPGVPSFGRKGDRANTPLARGEAGGAEPERKRLPEEVLFRLSVGIEGGGPNMSIEFPLNESPELTVVIKLNDEKQEYTLPRGDLEDIIDMILSCRIPLVPMIERWFGLMDYYTFEFSSGMTHYRFGFTPSSGKEPDPFKEIIVSLVERLVQLTGRWDLRAMTRHLCMFGF